MNRSARTLWLLLTVLLLLGGMALLAFFWLPFDQARGLADHLARDGSLEALSAARFTRLALPAHILGALLLGLGAAGLIGRRRSQSLVARGLAWTLELLRRLWRELRALLTALSPRNLSRSEGLSLLLLTGLAAAIRAVYVSSPLAHDEAYTIVAFATRPLWIVLSDYHLPNNHVFHSLLVHFSYQLFGLQPWAMRLPVLLAGTLLTPAACLFGRQLYGRWAGLLAAALAACTPWLVHISTDARGYVLISLFTLLSFSLAVHLRRAPSLAGWLLLALLSALGFYTTPVMLYPAGGVYLWLALSRLAGAAGPGDGQPDRFYPYWLVSGVLAALLSILFYAPILLTSGLRALTGNPFVLPLSWGDFGGQLPVRMLETWQTWNADAPFVGWLLLAGFILSLVFHRRISAVKLPIPLALGLWMSVEMALQRPYPWPKLWSFLLPLFLVWSAGGLLAVWERRFRLPRLAAGLGLALTLLAAAGGITRAAIDLPRARERGPVEETTLFLRSNLQAGDIVVVNSPDDAPLWYYFQLHAIPDAYVIDIQEREFTRAFVLVDAGAGQTLESVIQERGPDIGQFDLPSAQAAFQFGNLTTYLVGSLPK